MEIVKNELIKRAEKAIFEIITTAKQPSLRALGLVLSNCEKRFNPDLIAAVSFNKDRLKFVLHLGPELVNFNDKQFKFVLCHEAMHLLNLHIQRLHDRDPMISNIAQDCIINSSLVKWFPEELEPIEGIYFMPKDYNKPWLYEILYKDLENEKNKQKNNSDSGDPGDGRPDGSTDSGNGNGNNKRSGNSPTNQNRSSSRSNKGKGLNGKNQTIDKIVKDALEKNNSDSGNGNGNNKRSGNSSTNQNRSNKGKGLNDKNQTIDKIVKDALEKNNNGESLDKHLIEGISQQDEELAQAIAKKIKEECTKSMGKSGFAVEQLIISNLKRGQWAKEVKKILKQTFGGKDREDTWGRPNRRGFKNLPGYYSTGKEAAILMDISGSLEPEEIKKLLSQCLLKDVTYHVYFVNTKIVGYEKTKNINKLQFKTGGGTILNPALQEISKKHNVIIVLTDGFSDKLYFPSHVRGLVLCTVQKAPVEKAKVVLIKNK